MEEKNDDQIDLSVLNQYDGLAFVANNTLHISSELKAHPNMASLIFWANRQHLSVSWHNHANFAEYYSNLANPTKVGDNEIQRYVVNLLEAAYQKKASDIHIINTGNYTDIKFRVLGLLKNYDGSFPLRKNS